MWMSGKHLHKNFNIQEAQLVALSLCVYPVTMMTQRVDSQPEYVCGLFGIEQKYH